MIEIINKSLLVGEKFMHKMDSKQPGLTFNACVPFTKNKQKTKKFKESGNARYISDKVLRNKGFNTAKSPKYDGYQRCVASVVYKFLVQKSSGDAAKSEIMSKLQLPEDLNIPVTRKFEKWKVYSSFKDSIWDADLADMQLTSKFSKRIHILLGITDIYRKYASVVPLKEQKGIGITNVFQKIFK